MRTYLDWLVRTALEQKTKTISNIRKAKQVLDEDHYNLEKIKERILEYLAVKQATAQDQRSDICFVGPPGS